MDIGKQSVRTSRRKTVNRYKESTGDEWFTIEPPEAPDAPPRISAKFYGPNGMPELVIRQNGWECSTGVWDLEVVEPRIVVRSGQRRVMLRLKARPPHGLEIEYLKMTFHDTGISVGEDGTVVLKVDGTAIAMSSSKVAGAEAVYSVP